MKNLKFRRQFLFSSTKCDKLQDWNLETFGTYYLYTHPENDIVRVANETTEIILIGHVVNPYKSNDSVNEIIESFLSLETIEDISKKLYPLTGRFILIVKYDESYRFFHDACGLKMLFYTQENDNFYAASQPLLLEMVTSIKKSHNYQVYFDSEYVKNTIEHWIPSGISLYENVYHLVPNHYLEIKTFQQNRYWPTTKLIEEEIHSSVDKFIFNLKQGIEAISHKYKLALPLTAGWDSRLILGTCRDVYKGIWAYTLKYRDLTEESNDIKIPKKLSIQLNFKHTVINCIKPLDNQFIDIYSSNTDIPHVNDWGKIAFGMYDEYPKDRLAVKGNCSEVGRCFYYPSGKHETIVSSSVFLKVEKGWEGIPFIEEQIEKWFQEIKAENVHLGYDLYDLFYWEHRMGSWQAQSQLEWDIVQETYSPFNSRALFDIMLKVDSKYRAGVKNILFEKSMQKLWKEALSEPINPLTQKQKIKNFIKKVLLTVGIFDILKQWTKK